MTQPSQRRAAAPSSLINTISGAPGSGTDPRFVRNPSPGDGNWATLGDNDYGDLRLETDSPAIDAGDGSLLPAGITLDFPGSPRIFDSNIAENVFTLPVDQGAFEADYVRAQRQSWRSLRQCPRGRPGYGQRRRLC